MLNTTTHTRPLRELAQRRNDGFEVTLLWSESTDALTVTVHDTRSGEFLELGAPPAQALEAFYHPFAYAR